MLKTGKLAENPAFYASAVLASKNVIGKLKEMVNQLKTGFALVGPCPALAQFAVATFDANTPAFLNCCTDYRTINSCYGDEWQ